MPNVMVALSNIGGALYSTPQSLADAHYNMPCSNAAKTRNQVKTNETTSAASGPKFTNCGDIWRTYCCLTSFFPIVDTCLNCEDIARQSCAMVPRWRFLATFLRPVFFSEPRASLPFPEACFLTYGPSFISDLHSKFTLGPHHVWKYGRHRISDH